MAIVLCPSCGGKVSDKAKKCVHCGTVLIEEKIKCVECGSELDEGATTCIYCGCPVEKTNGSGEQEKPQKVEVTGVRLSRRVKRLVCILSLVSLVCGLIFFSVNQYQKKKTVKKYKNNLSITADLMAIGAMKAENSCNLIVKVWKNAIFEERNLDTDKYTYEDGEFVDFNTALKNLFLDDSFREKINSIEENQKEVDELMKKMKKPPKEYKDAYEALSEFYDAYYTFTNCAIDPSGSYQSYSSNFNDADTEAEKCYRALQKYIDE